MSQGNEGESLERQAEEVRKKLANAEERADEAVEHAAEELRELTKEQEKRADRLRKEGRESSGPLPEGDPES